MNCNSCGGEVVYDDSLQGFVCVKCGLVLDDRPIVADSPRPEREPWYSGGFTYRLHDHGVGGTVVSGNPMRHISEGRRWVARQLGVASRGERMLARTLKHLNSIARALNMPGVVVETAGRIVSEYIGATAGGISTYRDERARGVATASIYLALKMHGYPASINEMSRATGMDPRKTSRYIRELIGSVNVKPFLKRLSYAVYVHKIASSVNAQGDVEALASTILHAAEQTERGSGLSPVSLAAGAVYLSSVLLNKRIPQSRFKETGIVNTAGSFRKILEMVDIEVEL